MAALQDVFRSDGGEGSLQLRAAGDGLGFSREAPEPDKGIDRRVKSAVRPSRELQCGGKQRSRFFGERGAAGFVQTGDFALRIRHGKRRGKRVDRLHDLARGFAVRIAPEFEIHQRIHGKKLGLFRRLRAAAGQEKCEKKNKNQKSFQCDHRFSIFSKIL